MSSDVANSNNNTVVASNDGRSDGGSGDSNVSRKCLNFFFLPIGVLMK